MTGFLFLVGLIILILILPDPARPHGRLTPNPGADPSHDHDLTRVEDEVEAIASRRRDLAYRA